jgi:hypothetical protein
MKMKSGKQNYNTNSKIVYADVHWKSPMFKLLQKCILPHIQDIETSTFSRLHWIK